MRVLRAHTPTENILAWKIQYTYKEAHLTPADISEDWGENTFQNISSCGQFTK